MSTHDRVAKVHVHVRRYRVAPGLQVVAPPSSGDRPKLCSHRRDLLAAGDAGSFVFSSSGGTDHPEGGRVLGRGVRVPPAVGPRLPRHGLVVVSSAHPRPGRVGRNGFKGRGEILRGQLYVFWQDVLGGGGGGEVAGAAARGRGARVGRQHVPARI